MKDPVEESFQLFRPDPGLVERMKADNLNRRKMLEAMQRRCLVPPSIMARRDPHQTANELKARLDFYMSPDRCRPLG